MAYKFNPLTGNLDYYEGATDLDATYVNVTGDTMTGALSLIDITGEGSVTALYASAAASGLADAVGVESYVEADLNATAYGLKFRGQSISTGDAYGISGEGNVSETGGAEAKAIGAVVYGEHDVDEGRAIGGWFYTNTVETPTYSVGILADATNIGAITGITGDWAGWFRGNVRMEDDLRVDANLTDGTNSLTIANAKAAYDHVSDDGSDHSFIDQDVTSGANVTFGTIGCGAITTTGNIVLPADGVIGVTDGNPQIVFDNANNWLEITGDVGIGTSSPDSIFHIKANVAGTVGSHPAGQLIIQDPDDTVFGNAVITGYESDGAGNPDQQLWYLGSSSSSNSNIIFLNRRNSKLQLGTNDVSRLTILGDGNVGIGVTDPDTLLEILYAGNQLKLSFDGTDNAVFAVDTSGNLTITPSGTGITLAGTLGCGAITSSGDMVLTNALHIIATGTADGSDNHRILIAGGGTYGATRGAHVQIIGNEATSNDKGSVQIKAGTPGTTGTYDGMISFWPNAVLALTLDRSQNANFAEDVVVGGGQINVVGSGQQVEIVGGSADSVVRFQTVADATRWEIRDDNGVLEINQGADTNNRFTMVSGGAATFTSTIQGTNINATGVFKVDGVQVLTNQQPAILRPGENGQTLANCQLDILNALEAMGIIDT